ncbi:MAG: hypothetical protein WB868_15835 [Xanthobacteraceae bacterium]
MFQYRSNSFGPSVTAIQKHLGAVERELETVGRIAGRRGSAAASAAGERIGEAVSATLSELIDRVRERSQSAGEEAGRLGNRALRLGADYGNQAVERMSAQTQAQPLFTLGVALGVGILIGAAVLVGTAARK